MAQLSSKLDWPLANPKWASTLNPILAVPFLSGLQIDAINLTATTPKVINHLLQRKPQGWFVVDNAANAVIWRTVAFNDLTITLESDLATTISIWIY